MKCNGCNLERDQKDFSNAQIKKKSNARKCKYCVQSEHNQTLAPAHPRNIPVTGPVPPYSHVPKQIPMLAPPVLGPLQQQQHQVNFVMEPMITVSEHNKIVYNLQLENNKLRQEREELLKQALELALPVEIKKHVSSLEDEITRLRKENEDLRNENTALREQIADLRNQLAQQQKKLDSLIKNNEKLTVDNEKLMKSYKREDKIALRTLFELAKQKGIQLTSAQSEYLKNSKSTLNCSAHRVDQERIKDAINNIRGEFSRKTVADLYDQVFPDAGNEESEADEFFD